MFNFNYAETVAAIEEHFKLDNYGECLSSHELNTAPDSNEDLSEMINALEEPIEPVSPR